MRRMRTAVAATAATTLALGLAGPAVAAEAGGTDGVRVVATGLDGPRQLSFVHGLTLVVAESDSGEVTEVNALTGAQRAALSGLANPQGVDATRERLFVATGETAPDAPTPAGVPSLLKAGWDGGAPQVLSNLLQFELDFNPDRQPQFVNGEPVDTLSNPFAALVRGDSVLVADAGANAVLRVHRTSGRTQTWFLPPLITTGACEGAEHSPGVIGCDPVPTSLAHGPHGTVFVGTLGGPEVPNAARVYQVNAAGKVVRTIRDLTGVTGVAVGDDGSVYASELFHGAPQGDGPPPPGFDPSTIGRIVRIAPDGSRTYAQVTMPTGLEFRRGTLYASAWSVAGFFGMPSAGQVVAVSPSAFK